MFKLPRLTGEGPAAVGQSSYQYWGVFESLPYCSSLTAAQPDQTVMCTQRGDSIPHVKMGNIIL